MQYLFGMAAGLVAIWLVARFDPVRSNVIRVLGQLAGYVLVGALAGAVVTIGILGPASLAGLIKMAPKAWPLCFFGIAGAVAVTLTFRNWEALHEGPKVADTLSAPAERVTPGYLTAEAAG